MSEQKVSGKTITHAWFRTTEMFKDDSVIGIAKQEWDDLDTRIDAALRRAKAEGAREMIKIVKAHRADQRVADDLNNTVSFDSFNEVLDAITREADARAAQIEEGE